jgi:hypothetical protein
VIGLIQYSSSNKGLRLRSVGLAAVLASSFLLVSSPAFSAKPTSLIALIMPLARARKLSPWAT